MKIYNVIVITIILIVSSTLYSCTDSCNKKLGDTFNSIEVSSSTLNTTNQKVEIVFNMGTLSDLPEKYYIDGTFYDPKTSIGETQVDSSYITSNKIEMIIAENQVPTLNTSKSYSYQIHFGDRKDYIDCKHPGMSDSYLLDLNFDLKNNNSSLEISNFKWKENHSAGAI